MVYFFNLLWLFLSKLITTNYVLNFAGYLVFIQKLFRQSARWFQIKREAN